MKQVNVLRKEYSFTNRYQRFRLKIKENRSTKFVTRLSHQNYLPAYYFRLNSSGTFTRYFFHTFILSNGTSIKYFFTLSFSKDSHLSALNSS